MTSLLIRIAVTFALLIGGLYTAYHHGVTTTTDHYKAIIAEADKAHSDEVISLNKKVSQTEHKAALDMAAIDQRHQEIIKHEKEIADATLASYRAGTLRLRNEFQAHIIADSGLPSAATSTSKCDAACTGGLQPAHVEFLVSEASRANQVTLQLSKCQDVVRADRAVKP